MSLHLTSIQEIENPDAYKTADARYTARKRRRVLDDLRSVVDGRRAEDAARTTAVYADGDR